MLTPSRRQIEGGAHPAERRRPPPERPEVQAARVLQHEEAGRVAEKLHLILSGRGAAEQRAGAKVTPLKSAVCLL